MTSEKPRQVYYDININNQSSIGTTSEILTFDEIRNTPIINKASDYSLSIVRFEIDTYSLPTFIPNIEKFPNTDPNKMIETITLEYNGGTVGPHNLTWTSTNKHIATPPPLSISQPNQVSSEYYYGNSFRHYCDLVNNTLTTLTTQLKMTTTALNNLKPPVMIWNEDSQTASILAQEEFFNWSRTNHIHIYFNRSLYSKFTTFPALKNYNNTMNKIYKIYMKADSSTKIILLDPLLNDTTEKYIKTDQELSTVANWSPISSIVFTSNNLPVYPTQVSAPYVYYNGILSTDSGTQNNEKIITDMATNDQCYKPNLLYIPSAEYRYIDMFGINDITRININVYWRDKSGRLHPFYLQSGASCSIKVLFQLKV